ncbi:TPA: VasL domain-containing protein [Enterobacter cancerogenus]
MTTQPERSLKTGGDPRTLVDYARLRDEINKLSHPARPDVDWHLAETLCLSLFEQNGVELQTAAWYTQVRTQLAGLYGLNEGLAILSALVSRQWGSFWPQPVHARMEILSALSKRLQQHMRTQTLTYSDLSQLYQAEAHLKALDDVLQRLELKHAGQMEALRTLLHNASVRLENSAQDAPDVGHGIALPAAAGGPPEGAKWVYVAQPEPQPNIAVQESMPPLAKPWKPFAAGMLTMLVIAGASAWGWQYLHQPDPLREQFSASISSLPAPLSAAQIQSVREKGLPAEEGITQTQRQLARLAQLKPDWAVRYGDSLVQQAQALWPEQAKPLAQQWQQQVAAQAMPEENLEGWHQGMAQLEQLANRLNALDEQKGKYITVSELKSTVFTTMQSFNRAVPAEEQLRQLATLPDEKPWPAAQKSQLEQHLRQLMVRYALLDSKTAD